MADGHSNLSIATQLDIAEETVKSHVKSVGQRLGARNRAHTVSLGFRAGLLTARNDRPQSGESCQT
jgi:DNA-binding CsgD family transcriptional regulator